MRGQGRGRLRVLLVVMPFAASERPALGVSLLKAHLRERGIACDIAYLNLLFAERIGRQHYEHFVNDLPFRALPGEWVFAGAAWESADLPDTYIEDVLRGRWQLAAEDVGLVRQARGETESFLAEAIASLPWDDYDLVGFSSCASQNLASLALARRVKEVDPGMPVVFGGANWHGTPGKTLLERIEAVDFALSGEADISFPLLADWLAGEPGASLSEIPGLGYRQDGASRWNPEGAPIRDLDDLPTPDFSDFYAWRHRLPGVRSSLPSLVLEASGDAGGLRPGPVRSAGWIIGIVSTGPRARDG